MFRTDNQTVVNVQVYAIKLRHQVVKRTTPISHVSARAVAFVTLCNSLLTGTRVNIALINSEYGY